MRHSFEQYRPFSICLWRSLSLLLALTYFAFRVELFDEEEEQNHPIADLFCAGHVFMPSAVNWETFDKDNATKAFVVDPNIRVTAVGVLPPTSRYRSLTPKALERIRDKSPPQL